MGTMLQHEVPFVLRLHLKKPDFIHLFLEKALHAVFGVTHCWTDVISRQGYFFSNLHFSQIHSIRKVHGSVKEQLGFHTSHKLVLLICIGLYLMIFILALLIG